MELETGKNYLIRLWHVTPFLNGNKYENRPALAKVGDLLTLAQSPVKPEGRIALAVMTLSGVRVGFIPDVYRRQIQQHDAQITIREISGDGYCRIALRLSPRAQTRSPMADP